MATTAASIRLESRARRLHHRALGFAVAVGCVTVLVGAFVFSITEILLPRADLIEQNQSTLEKTHCIDRVCDISELTNVYDFTPSEYLIDKESRFLLNFDPPEGLKWRLHRSNGAFALKYRDPETFISPAGETWRLLSTEKQVGSHRSIIMIGYAVKVPWRLYFPISDFTTVDEQLKTQLGNLLEAVHEENGVLTIPSKMAARLPTDGFEIVDEDTNEILAGGYWLPVYLPTNVPLPAAGTSFLVSDQKLYMTYTSASENLVAVCTYLIGGWPTLLLLVSLLFLVAGLITYLIAITSLRHFLLIRESKPIEVVDALKQGEGPSVEFKRSISFEVSASVYQVLQTVAAFANTGDGSVFIGVEDDGKLKGVSLENQKSRDSLSHRLYHAIRERIKPTPGVKIDFLESGEQTVCRIFVPRGDDPLYFLDGVIYVRHGSADVKAQPELVRRILEEFAR